MTNGFRVGNPALTEKAKVESVCEKLGIVMPGTMDFAWWPRPILEVIADRIVQLELVNLATVNRVRSLQVDLVRALTVEKETIKQLENLWAWTQEFSKLPERLEDLERRIHDLEPHDVSLPQDDEGA